MTFFVIVTVVQYFVRKRFVSDHKALFQRERIRNIGMELRYTTLAIGLPA